MTSVLPDGLITIGHSQIQRDSSIDYADILFERLHIIHSFWKVHTVRHKVSRSTSDFRSQNLFWRTWSDGDLSRRITTKTLMSLWQDCQRDNDIKLRRLIAEVPLASELIVDGSETSHSSLPPVSTDTFTSNSPPGAWTMSEDTSAATQATAASTTRTKRQSSEKTVEAGVNHEAGRRPSQTTRPKLTRATSTNNRVSFGGSTARTKNRPALNRRKSSQTTMQNKTAKASKSSLKSPELTADILHKSDPPSSITETSTFRLPSPSSWEDEPGPERHRTAGSTSPSGATAELVVEPNFRNKFAERIASSTNLAGMSRLKKTGSVVRFADELPAGLDSNEEQDDNDSHEFQGRPGIPHRASIVSIASTAISDEDDVPLLALPRTKSQLSMMIDEKIAQHGRESFGSSQVASRNTGSTQERPKPTEEHKLLAMAHREGVTRAGGRQISRRFRLTEDSESRYSSPSPPPIF